jgi:biopolymer transport protein ExbD
MADVPKQQVLIRASKGIKYQEVASIISAAGMAEGADVYIAVIEE